MEIRYNSNNIFIDYENEKTFRQSPQSSDSVQGHRAADPLHQQQPGETGHNPGGQTGAEHHQAGGGDTAELLLGEDLSRK